jgi:hypothetical protein
MLSATGVDYPCGQTRDCKVKVAHITVLLSKADAAMTRVLRCLSRRKPSPGICELVAQRWEAPEKKDGQLWSELRCCLGPTSKWVKGQFFCYLSKVVKILLLEVFGSKWQKFCPFAKGSKQALNPASHWRRLPHPLSSNLSLRPSKEAMAGTAAPAAGYGADGV